MSGVNHETIGEQLARRQIARFVGRSAELGLFTRALDGLLDRNLLLVHGPGGVGKTTLLRAMQRVAEQAGIATRWVDCRSITSLVDALRPLVDERSDGPPVTFIDGFERVATRARTVQEEILAKLPAGALVVIAGRGRPDTDWRRDGWEQITSELPLRELSRAESRQLLSAHGVPPTAADRICDWAAGSPLALTLAAGAYAVSGQVDLELDLVNALVQVVTEPESDPAYFDALAVCALAWRTTVDLLRDTLSEGRDAESAFNWLASRSFVDTYSDAVCLTDVIRLPIGEHFRTHRPERERELRRLICDHLYHRAVNGDRFAVTELAHLLRDPALRWAYSWNGGSQFHVDQVRFGDIDFLGKQLRELGYADWWARSECYFREAANNVVVARDRTGRPVGYAIYLTPASIPPATLASDPIGARCVEYAHEISPAGEVFILRDSVDLSRSLGIGEDTSVLAMLNLAAGLRCDVANPRHVLLPAFRHNRKVQAFCAAVGGKPVPELEWASGSKRIGCYRIDFGAGGLYGALRDIVYRELDLVRQKPVTPPSTADVRAALEGFTSSTELASNVLATGSTVKDRANSVRAVLRDSADVVFGASPHEQQLRTILTMRYFEVRQGHDSIARTLTISRATYFRRLREAVNRLSDYIVSNSPRL